MFLFGTFVAMVVSFSIWFVGFTDDIYVIITNSVSNYSSSYSGLLGYILDRLGLDTFLNSAFAIFFSAAIFWSTAVGYIITYKLGSKVYDGLFKALS